VRHEGRSAWGFIAFPLAVIALFTALPTAAGLALSFFEWSGGGEAGFIGLENYRAMLAGGTFAPALRNTLVFAAMSVPITVVVAFALAAALNAPWFHGRTLARTLLFLPTIVSVVAIGFIWRWMLDPSPSGLFNHALATAGSMVGVDVQPRDWMANSIGALAVLIVISIWRGVGFSMVLYLAALSNVPRSLYEAAAVDGASPWQAMRLIAWPSVKPMTAFLLITGMISALQVFDLPMVMVGTIEQPWTDVLNVYLYREFTQSRLGFAAAIGACILVLTLLVTLAQLWRLKAMNPEAIA
jgi:multiple sugar transport system permease protein